MSEYDQAITNVVYTNGYFDPFRYFGRLYDATGRGIVVNMDCKFLRFQKKNERI